MNEFKRSQLCLLFLFACATLSAADSRKPNVLFIISDDLNTGLGSYGHAQVKSPNIDRLAARGLRFDRAYCQVPICGASRASMLTGRRPAATRLTSNDSHFRVALPDTVTMPQLFKNNGYYVARVGKLYHYGVPGAIGTDGVDDPPSWTHKVNPKGRDTDNPGTIRTLRTSEGERINIGGSLTWRTDNTADEEQTDGIGATEVIKLLEANKDKPFFLAMGFYRPHAPFIAPKKYFDLYPREKIPLAHVPEGHFAQLPAAAFMSRKPEQERLTDPLRREIIQAYFSATSFMDAQVGRVVNALDRLKLADNTIIVFTSDHGFHLGEHGLWQKQSLFENVARVPLIIVRPGGRNAGKSAAGPVELLDLYPTLAEMCGLDAPAYIEGTSLRPMLDDPSKSVKAGAFTQVQRKQFPGYAVSDGRFRYIEWDRGSEGVQLYDLKNDPAELKNLADVPEHARKRAELEELVAQNWPEDTESTGSKAKPKKDGEKKRKAQAERKAAR